MGGLGGRPGIEGKALTIGCESDAAVVGAVRASAVGAVEADWVIVFSNN